MGSSPLPRVSLGSLIPISVREGSEGVEKREGRGSAPGPERERSEARPESEGRRKCDEGRKKCDEGGGARV